MDSIYTPSPDVAFCKQSQKYLKFPQSEFTMLDKARQQEVDDFYIVIKQNNCYVLSNSLIVGMSDAQRPVQR